MKHKSGLIALLVSAFLWSGCGNSSTNPLETGKLKVSMTDAPARFEAMNVTFSEISANIGGEWVIVHSGAQTINLLEWNNGKAVVMGEVDVPAGTYNRLRLKIDGAEVVENGQTHTVDVPSDVQAGLELAIDFEVEAGATYEMVVDFDAHRSVVETESSQSSNRFTLKPTLRAVPLTLTGSISGSVSSTVHAPLAIAIAGSDTVTSTLVDSTSGEFKLAFLPPGPYSVVVQDTTGARASISGSVEVGIGADESLGMLNLQIEIGLSSN